MEVQRHLGLIGLLLLATYYVPATAVPSSQCQKQCGVVEIHYPFGIGKNCSLEWFFSVKCQVQDGISKPFIGEFELLDISLTRGSVRVLNYIASFCYNPSSGLLEKEGFGFNATNIRPQ